MARFFQRPNGDIAIITTKQITVPDMTVTSQSVAVITTRYGQEHVTLESHGADDATMGLPELALVKRSDLQEALYYLSQAFNSLSVEDAAFRRVDDAMDLLRAYLPKPTA